MNETGLAMYAAETLSTGELILYLLPVIIIQFSLMIFALIDLARREKVRTGNKVLWALIILLLNLIGPIIYLAWGRYPAEEERDFRHWPG